MSQYADVEVAALLSAPIHSTVKARWERKASADHTGNTGTLFGGGIPQTPKTPFADKINGAGSSSSSTSKTPGKQQQYAGDRFIPTREHLDVAIHLHNAADSASSRDATNDSTGEFKSQLANSLFNADDLTSKILSYKAKAPKPVDSTAPSLRVIYTHNQQAQAAAHGAKKATQRYVSSNPERILDAPDMVDDYYLNLLDWSARNVIAVGLGKSVYLWDAATGNIDLLCELKNDDDMVTSVSWMSDGTHVAVGTAGAVVQLWSVEAKRQVRSMKGHTGRVGALAWNSHILASGSRDNSIFQHDVRVAQHHVSTLIGHEQEICGLSWNADGTQLASGSNDNTCRVWDVSSSATQSAKFVFNDSVAAVKAVAWCPWQRNMLATGSGTADRHIRLYNTGTGVMTQSVDSGSQVCSLQWSRSEKELLSAHGFSQNQLSLWKLPQLVNTNQLTGHTSRVLHTCISPDGTTVCSAAADETLRFWKVWDAPASKKPASSAASASNASAMAERRGVLAINIR